MGRGLAPLPAGGAPQSSSYSRSGARGHRPRAGEGGGGGTRATR
jgi:hypothetical protein